MRDWNTDRSEGPSEQRVVSESLPSHFKDTVRTMKRASRTYTPGACSTCGWRAAQSALSLIHFCLPAMPDADGGLVLCTYNTTSHTGAGILNIWPLAPAAARVLALAGRRRRRRRAPRPTTPGAARERAAGGGDTPGSSGGDRQAWMYPSARPRKEGGEGEGWARKRTR